MDCYKRLKLSLSPDNKLYQDFESFPYGHVDVRGQIYDKKNTFKQFTVPMEYFDNEPILEIMTALNLQPKIFLVEPKYCYNWHRDGWRNIAFNTMLNDDPNYYVAFAPECPDDMNHRNMVYVKTEEVRYEPYKFVLFNTQVPHLSINTGDSPRYLLTVANYGGATASLQNKPAEYDEFLKTTEYLDQKNLVE